LPRKFEMQKRLNYADRSRMYRFFIMVLSCIECCSSRRRRR
jgi:hypothetical protein